MAVTPAITRPEATVSDQKPEDSAPQPTSEPGDEKPNPAVKAPPFVWVTHGYDPAKPNPDGSGAGSKPKPDQ